MTKCDFMALSQVMIKGGKGTHYFTIVVKFSEAKLWFHDITPSHYQMYQLNNYFNKILYYKLWFHVHSQVFIKGEKGTHYFMIGVKFS